MYWLTVLTVIIVLLIMCNMYTLVKYCDHFLYFSSIICLSKSMPNVIKVGPHLTKLWQKCNGYISTKLRPLFFFCFKKNYFCFMPDLFMVSKVKILLNFKCSLFWLCLQLTQFQYYSTGLLSNIDMFPEHQKTVLGSSRRKPADKVKENKKKRSKCKHFNVVCHSLLFVCLQLFSARAAHCFAYPSKLGTKCGQCLLDDYCCILP